MHMCRLSYAEPRYAFWHILIGVTLLNRAVTRNINSGAITRIGDDVDMATGE
jgi:hypothetical protein